MGTRCADHVTPLYPQKLALTSPTGGGRSVGIIRSRTKATEFFIVLTCDELTRRTSSRWYCLSAIMPDTHQQQTPLTVYLGITSAVTAKDLINCKPHVTAVQKLRNWILTGIVLHWRVVYTLYMIIQLSMMTSFVQDTGVCHLPLHSTLSPTPNENPIYETYIKQYNLVCV